MNCQDLQPQLEAYLDGTLGRSQQEALRGHLRRCPRCRAEVEAIRRFEDELAAAFADARPVGRIWERMQLDVTAGEDDWPEAAPAEEADGRAPWPASGRARAGPLLNRPRRPSPPPRRRRWPLLGALTVALVLIVVTVVEVQRGTRPTAAHGRVLQAPMAEFGVFLDSGRGLDLASVDPWKLQAWFAGKVDFRMPEPVSLPGARLQGGRLAQLLERRAAALAYEVDGRAVALYVMPIDGLHLPPVGPGFEPSIAREGDMTHVLWQRDDLVHSLVGELPEERLLGLARRLAMVD